MVVERNMLSASLIRNYRSHWEENLEIMFEPNELAAFPDKSLKKLNLFGLLARSARGGAVWRCGQPRQQAFQVLCSDNRLVL